MRGPKLTTRVSVALIGALMLVMSIGVTAMAAHSFTDVPDDHLFHGEIGWMKDHDITRGCNPPANTRYCPDGTTTRGEMAAFFYRFARSRAADAGMLEGHPADDFVLKSEIDVNALKPLADRVTLRTGTEGSGLVVLGNSYTVMCQPGEVALSGGFETDFTLVGDEVDGLLGPLSGVLGTLGIGGLANLGDTLDGVANVNAHGSMPVVVDGDWGWQVKTTADVLSDITVYALCGA